MEYAEDLIVTYTIRYNTKSKPHKANQDNPSQAPTVQIRAIQPKTRQKQNTTLRGGLYSRVLLELKI